MAKTTFHLKVVCEQENVDLVIQLCDDLNTVLSDGDKISADFYQYDKILEQKINDAEENIRKQYEHKFVQMSKGLKQREDVLQKNAADLMLKEKQLYERFESERKAILQAIADNLLKTKPSPNFDPRINSPASKLNEAIKAAINKDDEKLRGTQYDVISIDEAAEMFTSAKKAILDEGLVKEFLKHKQQQKNKKP
jgi:hypothetical protein